MLPLGSPFEDIVHFGSCIDLNMTKLGQNGKKKKAEIPVITTSNRFRAALIVLALCRIVLSIRLAELT